MDRRRERRSAMRESGANCHDKYAGREAWKLLPLLGPCHFCLLAPFRASHRIEELKLGERLSAGVFITCNYISAMVHSP